MKAKIYILPKEGISDPQGTIVIKTLNNLNFAEVSHVRVGKFIEIEINSHDKQEASDRVKAMCETLLVNLLIEEYSFEIINTTNFS